MRITNTIVALLLPFFLVATPALAQQSRVVDSAALGHALAGKAEQKSAQRDQVRRVLARADVREMAASMGLSVAQADAAVATLSDVELGTLAQHAAAVEAAPLTGGANTIVISTTTLLLVLIIVILIAK